MKTYLAIIAAIILVDTCTVNLDAPVGNDNWHATQFDGHNWVTSGNIGNGQTTGVVQGRENTASDAGEGSFQQKVSSESGFDQLLFCLDRDVCDRDHYDWRVSGVQQGLHRFAISAGNHTIKFFYSKDASVSDGQDDASVRSLHIPCATCNQSVRMIQGNQQGWTTRGNAHWVRDHQWIQSGNIGNNQQSQVSLTAQTSSGTMSFIWKTSSEPNQDFLIFCIDNANCRRTQRSAMQNHNVWAKSGQHVHWHQDEEHVSAGTHTFTWVQTKDGSISDGHDDAMVTGVVTPGLCSPQVATKSQQVDNLVATTSKQVDDGAWPKQLAIGGGAATALLLMVFMTIKVYRKKREGTNYTQLPINV